jgi:transposase
VDLTIRDLPTLSSGMPPGRSYCDKKIAEAKTKKEALRALKRRISNAVYRHLVADQQATTS